MMKKTILLSLSLLTFLLIVSLPLTAQIIEIKGNVKNSKGEPLKASIYIKSSKLKSTTNDDGTFIIKCEKKDKVKFSAVGYVGKNVKIKGHKTLEVKLKRSGIDYSEYSNFTEIIDSQYAGIVQVNGSGFSVSFYNKFGNTTVSPKCILDGFEVQASRLLNLEVSLITKVEVLREQADITKYGKPAIVVETKAKNSN